MNFQAKNYLGAIEIELDGILYETGLREEATGAFRGMWNCSACKTMEVTSELKSHAADAIDLAKRELAEHHTSHHKVHRTRRVNNPR